MLRFPLKKKKKAELALLLPLSGLFRQSRARFSRLRLIDVHLCVDVFFFFFPLSRFFSPACSDDGSDSSQFLGHRVLKQKGWPVALTGWQRRWRRWRHSQLARLSSGVKTLHSQFNRLRFHDTSCTKAEYHNIKTSNGKSLNIQRRNARSGTLMV